jgi:hypothetical protein
MPLCSFYQNSETGLLEISARKKGIMLYFCSLFFWSHTPTPSPSPKIPEFPAWIIPLIIAVSTTLLLAAKRNRLKKNMRHVENKKREC